MKPRLFLRPPAPPPPFARGFTPRESFTSWRIRGRGVTFSRLDLLLVPRDAYVADLVSVSSANL